MTGIFFGITDARSLLGAMAGRRRLAVGGCVYHVLNRGNRRATLFSEVADYQRFRELLGHAGRRYQMPLLAYCVMPNHWHLVVWPAIDGALSAYMHWLTNAHIRQHQRNRGTRGEGHVYQGRYKAFPVQNATYLWNVLRYVEANPLRAHLVRKAEDWRWSSLAQRTSSDSTDVPTLAAWPIGCPEDWLTVVNASQADQDLRRLRAAAYRGRPYGDETWVTRIVEEYGLSYTVRRRGRPEKMPVIFSHVHEKR